MNVSLRGRIVAGVAAALLALLLIGGFLSEGGSEGDRPTASGLDKSGDGLLGWSLLLREGGRDVTLEGSAPTDADLDPAKTAVLIDPGELADSDVAALRSFLGDGGRLVIGGDVGADGLDRLSGGRVGEGGAGSPATLTPLVPVPELAEVSVVDAGGEGRYTSAGGALPILGAASGIAALLSDVGQGRLIMLADPSPLRNALLSSGDNARLALGLAGAADRSVVFLLRVRSRSAGGIAALPESWLVVALGLLGAALTLIWARVRRFGPPSSSARELPPPRRAYVGALAVALARTKDPGGSGEPLRAAAGAIVARRAGLRPDAEPQELIAAARRLGLSEPEAASLASAGDGERELMEASSALARLLEKTGWR